MELSVSWCSLTALFFISFYPVSVAILYYITRDVPYDKETND